MSINIEEHLNTARQYLESGKHENARLLLLEILKQEPGNEAALMMLGGAYFSIGMFQEAEMAFERLVLLEPGRGAFSIALFNALRKQGRTEEALEEIKRFLSTADRETEKEVINQYLEIAKQFNNEST